MNCALRLFATPTTWNKLVIVVRVVLMIPASEGTTEWKLHNPQSCIISSVAVGLADMTDTTTIEITDEQKAQLDNLKAPGQSYKGVIDSLIDQSDGSSLTYEDVKNACQKAIQEEL